MKIKKLLENRLLPVLPRPISRFGYDVTRGIDLRNLRSLTAQHPMALLATNDLSLSGAPRIVLEMATILKQCGYAVVLVSMADGPMRCEFEALGVFVLIDCYPQSDKPYLLELGRLADFAIANTVVTANIALAWASCVKTFWYLHEVSLLSKMLSKESIIKALNAVSKVWAGSGLCAGIVRDFRTDVDVFPYGVPPVEPPKDGASKPAFCIGVFGSIELRKGQDYVVDAVRMLDQTTLNGLKVDFYGRVLDRSFAHKLMKRANGYPMIGFHGELSRGDYLESIKGCDAILVSSRDDTLPLVSLDALSAKRMLLLTPSVGTAAWLTDGVDALIAADTSSTAVCDLIKRATAEQNNAWQIGEAGRHTFERHFSQTAFRKEIISKLGIEGKYELGDKGR